MARMKSKLLVMGLAGLLAVPAAYAGGPAVNTPSPYTTPSVMPTTNPMSVVTNGMSGLTQMNGLAGLNALTGQNFGQMLMNAVVTQVTSQLLGKIDPSGMLGQMAGAGFGGLTNTGLTSNLMGGGIQNAMSGGTMNFGGLVNGALQGAVNGVVQVAVQQVLGGIQGGSDENTDSGSSGSGISIGGTVDPDAPVLAYTTNIDTGSTNFVAGQYDAAQGLQPDSRFLMNDGTYDSNYWAGYSRALVSNGVQI